MAEGEESTRTRFGEYELVSRLAAGGMATVYIGRKPEDPAHGPVAIKVIHEHLSSDWEAMRWFIDEALISVRIRHPNVARVDELGEQDGLYYLAMEYVHGASLAQLLSALAKRGRRLEPWLAVWIAARVAEGLHAAHELRGEEGELLNVIHRDISPQNVLLGHEGEVKLVDFGIAKAQGRAERTKQGELRGKFRYMAPEQVMGGDQDRRIDVFALGVVLWEMLTQKRMHGGLTPDELMDAVRAPAVERPSTIRDDVPPGVEGILLNALAARREERPHSAEVLRQELDAALAANAPGFDGPVALAGLMRDVLGPELLASAQRLPEDLAKAVGIEQLEPTIPRARRDEETGKIIVEKAAPHAPGGDDAAAKAASRQARREAKLRAREEAAEGGGRAWLWVGLLLLVAGGALAALAWLALS
ncbi:MAG TPA: serine/threonine-protein kinase [Polyangiaceae bacterium LLY-WYZ-15_(1-7)]|nr:hypothetical protein [Myxococcales bacterium]MAT28204.1 hypothetical protein [Sandaracinus sp.]HJL02500.1 serine/threonine-protein kinase [Polyangiaceae bacterium LLY-WYZ-15_(1-7)]MBJ72398.1 hypothetical protein [Sandaracinus sp.]HJL08406.1 serine/threonine-protein kinase [Polyangiaceae bacterium LLY-WYZ-15_(1-7)]